jgi:transcriptional regulator with XRE-family HTH domain
VEVFELLERARAEAGLSQGELARRAGTSRTTLSAYEHGRKSPTLATAARLLSHAGFELAARPRIAFTERPAGPGETAWVPDRLPRLPVAAAFARVRLPARLAGPDRDGGLGSGLAGGLAGGLGSGLGSGLAGDLGSGLGSGLDGDLDLDLAVRADRARAYEVVLRRGRPADILAVVDGALLVDLWPDLDLPPALRAAWAAAGHPRLDGRAG